MTHNVGAPDAAVRAMIAVVLVVSGFIAPIPGYVSFAAVLAGIILMGTALTRECPLYRLLHIATLRHHHHRA
jgi:hypothetical protein